MPYTKKDALQQHRAICGNCLRAPQFSTMAQLQAAHEAQFNCVCGGEFCACPGCLDSLIKLENGARGNVDGIGCYVHSWTAQDGVNN
jgi:hypothetical protein